MAREDSTLIHMFGLRLVAGIAFEEMSGVPTRPYRKFDEDFKHGAVQLVTQAGKSIAQALRGLGEP